MQLPAQLDRRMFQSYLADHLVAASGGRARIRAMVQWYAEADIGPTLAELAVQLDEEHAHVEELIDRFGLRQPTVMRVVARAAELAGRLKPNGRVLVQAQVTPLFELELLRAAVNGKMGLWQVLAAHADSLGLDAAEYEQRTANARSQTDTLEQLHARLRPVAFDSAAEPGGG